MANLFQAKITEAVLFHKEGRCVHNRYGRQEVDGVIEKSDGCHEDAESSRPVGSTMRTSGSRAESDGHEVCEKISFFPYSRRSFPSFHRRSGSVPLLEDLDIDIRFANFIFKNDKIHIKEGVRHMADKGGFSSAEESGYNKDFHDGLLDGKGGPHPLPLLLIISK